MRSFATFPSKFSRRAPENSDAVGSARASEFRKDPGETKFSDVARLFVVVRSFVPARWKCWPATKLRNSRESVAEGRVGGSSKEQNREEGKGPKDERYGLDDMGGGVGRCLDSVENMEGVRERVCCGWIGVKVRQPDVYACYSRVSGMARITINMLDSRLTAVVPVPTRRHPRRTHPVGLPPSIWQTL